MKNIKKFETFINEEVDGSTTSSPGSGTSVGGDSHGGFVSSAGVSVSGGDSASAFSSNSSGTSNATLSNTSGMGKVVSSQPSSVPGDVAGSTKGSGDVSRGGMTFTKKFPNTKKRKRKKSYDKKASNIDKLYTSKYVENIQNGKVIPSWDVFKEMVLFKNKK